MSGQLFSKASGVIADPRIRLSMLDKRVIQALANNSDVSVDDPDAPAEVRDAIAAFIACALKLREVETLVARHSLTLHELNSMYWSGLQELLPNPQISVGAPMLAPSLLFFEPIRLREVVEVALKRHAEAGPGASRLDFLEDCTAEVAAGTKVAHDAAKPPPPMPAPGPPVTSRVSSGCALMLALVGLASSLLVSICLGLANG